MVTIWTASKFLDFFTLDEKGEIAELEAQFSEAKKVKGRRRNEWKQENGYTDI